MGVKYFDGQSKCGDQLLWQSNTGSNTVTIKYCGGQILWRSNSGSTTVVIEYCDGQILGGQILCRSEKLYGPNMCGLDYRQVS